MQNRIEMSTMFLVLRINMHKHSRIRLRKKKIKDNLKCRGIKMYTKLFSFEKPKHGKNEEKICKKVKYMLIEF